jgi:hypothetical protein
MYESLDVYRADAQARSGEWSIEAVIDEWHAVYDQVVSGA